MAARGKDFEASASNYASLVQGSKRPASESLELLALWHSTSIAQRSGRPPAREAACAEAAEQARPIPTGENDLGIAA